MTQEDRNKMNLEELERRVDALNDNPQIQPPPQLNNMPLYVLAIVIGVMVHLCFI